MHDSGTIPVGTLVRAEHQEQLPLSGISLLADTGQTGGQLTSQRSIFRAGEKGAPPHFHGHASELFYVLEGRLQVLLGEETVILEKGDVLVVPPKMPHAFVAAENTDAEVLFVFTSAPPRFDYYRLLESVHRGESDPAVLGASQEQFDNHYVASPVWDDVLRGRIRD